MIDAKVTGPEYDEKLDELDRLLNDPDSKMEPARVWSLLAEISEGSGGLPHPVAQPAWTSRTASTP